MTLDPETTQADPTARWCPLDRDERRVLGVLIEKSKTTPSTYPLTLNAITTGCNQKSNRKPLLQLAADDVQVALDRLREVGAVAEIHGDGRAVKFKHKIYAWMDVTKVQAAVMAELLLRGEQTLGELRARASRMESIPDQAALRPVIDELLEKRLMIELTPRGRGQIVTHNLYLPEQLEKLRRQVAGSAGGTGPGDSQPAADSLDTGTGQSSAADAHLAHRVQALEKAVEQLQQRLAQIETMLE